MTSSESKPQINENNLTSKFSMKLPPFKFSESATEPYRNLFRQFYSQFQQKSRAVSPIKAPTDAQWDISNFTTTSFSPKKEIFHSIHTTTDLVPQQSFSSSIFVPHPPSHGLSLTLSPPQYQISRPSHFHHSPSTSSHHLSLSLLPSFLYPSRQAGRGMEVGVGEGGFIHFDSLARLGPSALPPDLLQRLHDRLQAHRDETLDTLRRTVASLISLLPRLYVSRSQLQAAPPKLNRQALKHTENTLLLKPPYSFEKALLVVSGLTTDLNASRREKEKNQPPGVLAFGQTPSLPQSQSPFMYSQDPSLWSQLENLLHDYRLCLRLFDLLPRLVPVPSAQLSPQHFISSFLYNQPLRQVDEQTEGLGVRFKPSSLSLPSQVSEQDLTLALFLHKSLKALSRLEEGTEKAEDLLRTHFRPNPSSIHSLPSSDKPSPRPPLTTTIQGYIESLFLTSPTSSQPSLASQTLAQVNQPNLAPNPPLSETCRKSRERREQALTTHPDLLYVLGLVRTSPSRYDLFLNANPLTTSSPSPSSSSPYYSEMLEVEEGKDNALRACLSFLLFLLKIELRLPSSQKSPPAPSSQSPSTRLPPPSTPTPLSGRKIQARLAPGLDLHLSDWEEEDRRDGNFEGGRSREGMHVRREKQPRLDERAFKVVPSMRTLASLLLPCFFADLNGAQKNRGGRSWNKDRAQDLALSLSSFIPETSKWIDLD